MTDYWRYLHSEKSCKSLIISQMICINQFSAMILLHKVPFSLEIRSLSCQSASGERKKHCHRRMVIPPPSLFNQVTPRILKTRRKSKAQKTLLWVKQQTSFARPLSALIKSAADTGQDSPAWLIAEDLALLKVSWNFVFIDFRNFLLGSLLQHS